MTKIGTITTDKPIETAQKEIKHWLGMIGVNGMDIDLRYDAKINVATLRFKYKDVQYEFTSRTQKNCRLNMWAIARLIESKVRFHLQQVELFGDAMYRHRLQLTGEVQESQSAGKADEKFYTALGLTPLASNDEIKTRYKELLQTYHPDMALSARAKSEFEERAKAITEAFAEIKKERGFV